MEHISKSADAIVVQSFHGAFEAPLKLAQRRADAALTVYLANPCTRTARQFDEAAEAHQIAAYREACARKFYEGRGL